METSLPLYFDIIAFLCTSGAIGLALRHIYKHLVNYTEPTYQRYIVRIIFMVPVYALMSFLSLLLNDCSIYFNSFREIYEAWVIYNFLSLCLAWVGGPGAVVLSLTGRVMKPSWFLMTCCLPPISLDGRFIRRCKQGGLQFVILKPILVVVTLILYAKGKYHDGNFSPSQSYLYLTIIYTISYSLALYALVLFYVACKDLLQPFNPVPKFIIIKSVVFLTYWQGVLVFLAAKSRLIKDADEAARFQDFIICVEMLGAALGHLYAFPYKEYAGANIGASHGFTASLAHALMLNDFYHDTVHQFAPTYHDYVLYNHGEGDEGTRKYRSRTFVPTGPEMDAVRRNKHMFGNKMDEVQLSNLSSSATSTPKRSKLRQRCVMAMIDQSLTGSILRNDSMEQQSFLNSYSNFLVMEKRQLFLRSYQFSRKRTLSKRIRRSLVRSKRVLWVRLGCVRKLRKLVWSKLFNLRQGFCHRRRYSRFFRRLSSNSYYYSQSLE